jgi:hypothetical protein
MDAGDRSSKPNRVVQVLQLAAATAGAVASYDFGLQISGIPLAVLMAANGAFFGSIMVSYVADLLARGRATSSGSARRGSSG